MAGEKAFIERYDSDVTYSDITVKKNGVTVILNYTNNNMPKKLVEALFKASSILDSDLAETVVEIAIDRLNGTIE